MTGDMEPGTTPAPRISPPDLFRETCQVVRLRWPVLLVLGLSRIALDRGLDWALDRTVAAARLMAASDPFHSPWEWLMMGSGVVFAYLSFWADGFFWMAMAIVASAFVSDRRIGAGEAIGSGVALSGRWSRLVIILIVVGSGAWFIQATVATLLARPFDPAIVHSSEWLLRSSPYGLLQEGLGDLLQAALAYITFAPLALALESAAVGSALAVSWRRVRRSWLRVCGTAILLWIPYGALRIPFRYVPASPVATASGVVVRGLAWAFLLVGAALMYIRLALAHPEDVPASERTESGPPIAGLRPLAP